MAPGAGALIAAALGLLLVVANAWVSAGVVRYAGSTRAQKAWQCAIVWLVPVFGVLLVWGLMRSDIGMVRAGDVFKPQDDQGMSSPEFDRPELQQADF